MIGMKQTITSAVALLISLCSVWPLAAQDFGERIRNLDANRDGRLSEAEMPGRYRYFLQRAASNAGLDTSRPIAINAFIEAIEKARDTSPGEASRSDSRSDSRRDRGRNGGRDRDRDSDRRGSRPIEEEPLVPGFGQPLDLSPVPGFGDAPGDGTIRSQGVPLEDRFNSRVIRFADSILRRYDRNKSGVLERAEWASARWRSDPAQSDLNGDGQLTREELCERVKGYDGMGGSDRSNSSDSRGSSSDSEDDQEKRRDYVKSLMRQYDENKNGRLDRDEWSRGSYTVRTADADKDGDVTERELADRLNSFSKGTSGAVRGGWAGDSSNTSSDTSSAYRTNGRGQADGRRTYRALSPTERLPKGLPDWFVRNDANADGQIVMSEFASNWTDDKLREFVRLDANSDGVITPQEILQQQAESSPRPSYRRR